jgi:hypothetical protein
MDRCHMRGDPRVLPFVLVELEFGALDELYASGLPSYKFTLHLVGAWCQDPVSSQLEKA